KNVISMQLKAEEINPFPVKDYLVLRQANFAGKTRENKKFLLPLFPLPCLTRQCRLVRALDDRGSQEEIFIGNG
ncbi:MAG: hypothetical protein AAF915_17975, partial [Cyanobacteria bacterium P01_D01_bin.50]